MVSEKISLSLILRNVDFVCYHKLGYFNLQLYVMLDAPNTTPQAIKFPSQVGFCRDIFDNIEFKAN
jgi:hypothetical protein